MKDCVWLFPYSEEERHKLHLSKNISYPILEVKAFRGVLLVLDRVHDLWIVEEFMNEGGNDLSVRIEKVAEKVLKFDITRSKIVLFDE